MNLRRGVLRILLVATIGWVAFVSRRLIAHCQFRGDPRGSLWCRFEEGLYGPMNQFGEQLESFSVVAGSYLVVPAIALILCLAGLWIIRGFQRSIK